MSHGWTFQVIDRPVLFSRIGALSGRTAGRPGSLEPPRHRALGRRHADVVALEALAPDEAAAAEPVRQPEALVWRHADGVALKAFSPDQAGLATGRLLSRRGRGRR